MPARTATVAAPPAAGLSRAFQITLAALCALFLFGLFSPEIYDSDFWWHLRTGQYIAENRALPVPDPFSWTTAQARDTYPGESRTRHFNLTHEWLAQLAFYTTWRGGGFPAIVAARALTMTAFCGLVGLIAWRRRTSFYAALFAALACASVARIFAFDRPYHASYLFLAATLAILEFRRFLWLLPPVFLVWANCHGGYFLGWIVLGAWCAASLLQRRRDPTLWIVTALSVLASGINPNAYQAFRALLDYRQSFLQSRLLEWTRPALWPPSEFSVLLAAGLAALVWARRRARMADWMIWIVFAAAALSAYRNIVLIGIFAPIVIAAYAPWKWRLPSATPYAFAFALIAAFGFGVASGRFFQFRAAEWKYPKGAADFLAQHHITQRIFNTYEHGGYLMWRGVPTFIDGRALSESVFQDYARILYNHDASDGLPSADDLLARYGVEAIVMNTFEPSTGPIYVLAPALADPAQTTWKLVYNDPQSLIFMRNPPPGVQPLNSLDVLTHMEDECALHLAHEPQLGRCARSLGQTFAKVGDFQRARKWIGIYLDHPHPPDPEAETAYRRMF
uniref:Glycosyltransferase RgtA/B/C/D-like domain-containing protein n=1 Tax=Solibacter usitatus (strain Ellin6076) TaxID=234267 RepID=Q024M6_SOLUE